MTTRRRRVEEPEEHENHERWLITYADMITLLMVLFIVMFAISQVDLAKFEKFKDGLDVFGNGGGQSLIELGGDGLLSEPALLRLEEAQRALADQGERAAAAVAEQGRLAEAQRHITESLASAGLGDAVSFRTERRGLVVTIVTDQVLFRPGDARLTAEGFEVIDVISDALAPLANRVSIEGHTDSVPIATDRFPSNWELSTARATSVLQALIQRHGIAPGRLSAAGYADQRALAPNDTATGRATNRRVEVVVHSTLETGATEGADDGKEA